MRLLSTTTKQKSEDVANSKLISGSIGNTTKKKQPGTGNKTMAAAGTTNSVIATGSNAAVMTNGGASEQDDFSFMNKRNAATNFQSYAQTHFSQNNREKSPGLKKSVGLNL